MKLPPTWLLRSLARERRFTLDLTWPRPDLYHPHAKETMDPETGIRAVWNPQWEVWASLLSRSHEAAAWACRMSQHRNGILLLEARTDTQWFHKYVWPAARALFFFRRRLRPEAMDGTPLRETICPSVMAAYGESSYQRLCLFYYTDRSLGHLITNP